MRLREMDATGEKGILLRFAEGQELRCPETALADFALVPGRELDEEEFAALEEVCAAFQVLRKAAALLALRPLSGGELRRKLTEKGAGEEHARQAVERLTQLGLLDEGEYAAAVVRHCARKGYGRRRAQQELYRHLVPRECWEEALDALPDSGEALDALVAAKLRGTAPTPEQLRRLGDSLCRRGYSYEEVRAALRRHTNDQDED